MRRRVPLMPALAVLCALGGASIVSARTISLFSEFAAAAEGNELALAWVEGHLQGMFAVYEGGYLARQMSAEASCMDQLIEAHRQVPTDRRLSEGMLADFLRFIEGQEFEPDTPVGLAFGEFIYRQCGSPAPG